MNKTEKDKRNSKMYSNLVSISSFNKGQANKIFEEVKVTGVTAVLKNNKRIGVIVSPSIYDEMIEKLEDYELMLVAEKRVNSVKNNESVSMKNVMKMTGITEEDLDKTKENIDI